MSVKPSPETTSQNTDADKGMLFCVSCPYSSRYDDGWATVETDDSVHYLCPSCGTEITTRSSGESPTVRTAASPVVGARER